MPSKLRKIQNAIVIEKDGESVGRLDIAGEVGWDFYGDAWDAGYFNRQLQNLGDVKLLEVHINSPGGSVIDGIAIYNYLVQHPAQVHVYIDGVAASIASVIAMAGDRIFMPSNTLMFVHEPWVYTAGNADQLRNDAEALDRMSDAIVNSYARHLKGSSDSIKAIMKAETWLTAEEAAETFNNVVVMAQETTIKAALDFHNLGDGVKVPKAAKAFLFDGQEDDENEPVAKKSILPDFVVQFLNKKGFGKAAKEFEDELKALHDLDEQNQHKENDDMKPEEAQAIAEQAIKDATEGIVNQTTEASTKAFTAVLVEHGLIADPNAKKDEPAVIPFEGDPANAEDVKKHKAKLESAKAAEILNSGDEKAIDEYLAKLEGSKTGGDIGGNTMQDGKPQNRRTDKPETEQDRKDTRSFMDTLMPKR